LPAHGPPVTQIRVIGCLLSYGLTLNSESAYDDFLYSLSSY